MSVAGIWHLEGAPSWQLVVIPAIPTANLMISCFIRPSGTRSSGYQRYRSESSAPECAAQFGQFIAAVVQMHDDRLIRLLVVVGVRHEGRDEHNGGGARKPIGDMLGDPSTQENGPS